MSTARRCGGEIGSALASAVLFIVTGSIGATTDSLSSRHSVTSGSSSFNAFGICRAMGKYWQTSRQMTRSMFAHAEILMGKNDHRVQACPYRIFR
jgi:hypothetical protein